MNDKNPYAFPFPYSARVAPFAGMTLRDYFAGQALSGVMGSEPSNTYYGVSFVAQRAYEIADAMLDARSQGEPEARPSAQDSSADYCIAKIRQALLDAMAESGVPGETLQPPTVAGVTRTRTYVNQAVAFLDMLEAGRGLEKKGS